MKVAAGTKQRKRVARCHTAAWPPMYSKDYERDHRLCAITRTKPGEWQVVWDDGEPEIVTSYNEWKEVMALAGKGVDCYVPDLADNANTFPWLDAAIADVKQAQVICNSHREISSIIVRQGNHWTSVGSLKYWIDNPLDRNLKDMFTTIKDSCAIVGCGIRQSPSALGTALLTKEFRGKLVTRPSNRCRRKIVENQNGGRVEFYSNDTDSRKNVHELDLSSAYASCAGKVPIGSTIVLPETAKGNLYEYLQHTDYATWYVRCIVTIKDKLPLGPFGVRKAKGNVWTYPREPGTYGDSTETRKQLWLWREEIQDCIDAGCTVNIREGYAWDAFSNALQPYVDKMYRLRRIAEEEDRADLASIFKKCMVAAIGRFGIKPERVTLLHDKYYRRGTTDELFNWQNGRGPISCYILRHTYEENCPAPQHWHSYIVMQCRRKLYHRELEELNDGNVIIGSNFDALYLLHASKRNTGTSIGEWKPSQLTDARFPFARAVIANEKTILPGQSGLKREQWIHPETTEESLPKARGQVPYVHKSISLPRVQYHLQRIRDNKERGTLEYERGQMCKMPP